MTDPDDVIALSQRLLQEQGELAPARAEELALKILGAAPDIADAAREWAHSGVMPLEPQVEGLTPRELDRHLFPSQTFTTLMALRLDPERAQQAMKRIPGRRARTAGGRNQ